MKRQIISQREAQRLKARVAELEALEDMRRREWCHNHPSDTYIACVKCSNHDHAPTAIATARRLGHAVIVTSDGQALHLYALPVTTC